MQPERSRLRWRRQASEPRSRRHRVEGSNDTLDTAILADEPSYDHFQKPSCHLLFSDSWASRWHLLLCTATKQAILWLDHTKASCDVIHQHDSFPWPVRPQGDNAFIFSGSHHVTCSLEPPAIFAAPKGTGRFGSYLGVRPSATSPWDISSLFTGRPPSRLA